MPKLKHWNSEADILAAIDRLNKRRLRLCAWIERDENEAAAKLKIANGDGGMVELAKEIRARADRRRKMVTRLEQSTIPSMGRTLAAFRTATIPGVVTGNDIVTQR